MLTSTTAAATTVREVAVPPAVRTRSTLAHLDYADAFVVDIRAAQSRTAEEWARAILEGPPLSVQRQLRWGWKALGLKRMPAELLLERRQRSLSSPPSCSTTIARAVWAASEPVHVPIVRRVLAQAGKHHA